MSDRLNLTLPGNLRYQPRSLQEYFGYDYLYRELAAVELATLATLNEIGFIPDENYHLLTPETTDAIMAIPTTEVDQVEREITSHDVRAWIYEGRTKLDPRLGRWVHIPLTSYDPLDTGRTLQFLKAYRGAVKPLIKEAGFLLTDLVERFAGQLQIGRTHGQHALPITVGFWLATILSRYLYNFEQMDIHADGLVGMISGAVGAYNASTGLGIEARVKEATTGDWTFEKLVLRKLGLEPARISTQILPPEPLAYFLFAALMLSATIAQLGRDGRHLMRSEIAEFAEAFEETQDGSSTMAHKRNPITFENLEGMYWRTKNEFGKVLDTLISEHQRDLVGSSPARDFPIIIVNLVQQLGTLTRKKKDVPFLARVTINAEACQRNFEMSKHLILSEPLYIALQMAGYDGDAHNFVNHVLTPKAQKSGRMLVEILEDFPDDDPAKTAYLAIPADLRELLHHPEQYTGRAKEKALEIAALAREQLGAF